MRWTARKRAGAPPQGGAPRGVGRQHQFELHVPLRPEGVDGITKHVNEFVERVGSSRDAGAFEDAPDVLAVFPVDSDAVGLHGRCNFGRSRL